MYSHKQKSHSRLQKVSESYELLIQTLTDTFLHKFREYFMYDDDSKEKEENITR